MIRPPSRADLGGELIAPLAREHAGARCIDARLSPSGGSLRVIGPGASRRAALRNALEEVAAEAPGPRARAPPRPR